MRTIAKMVKADIRRLEGLSSDVRALLSSAHAAHARSSVLISRHTVGAAIRSTNHVVIYSGATVEDVDPEVSAVAERVAIRQLHAWWGVDARFKALARVVGIRGEAPRLGAARGPEHVSIEDLVPPDPATLGLIWRASGENPYLPIYTMLPSGDVVLQDLRDLLPFQSPAGDPDLPRVVP